MIGSVERVSNKRYESIMVSAYVHVGGETFTEIKWRDPEAETEYAAWSNVDFRLLVDPATLETETLVFFWFPFVMAFPAEASDTAHPAGLAASGTPDYVLIGKAAELPSEHPLLQALDAVHAHVQLNREALEKRQHERQFQADEAERLLTAASQTKKTVTLRFWPLPRRNAP
ncbi:MAG: hypothetical protein Q8M02_13185 [Candidatus Didemnitutus sp.]|nr:hypothetical protein [Candidatus Didemnitutus sp.]